MEYSVSKNLSQTLNTFHYLKDLASSLKHKIERALSGLDGLASNPKVWFEMVTLEF